LTVTGIAWYYDHEFVIASFFKSDYG